MLCFCDACDHDLVENLSSQLFVFFHTVSVHSLTALHKLLLHDLQLLQLLIKGAELGGYQFQANVGKETHVPTRILYPRICRLSESICMRIFVIVITHLSSYIFIKSTQRQFA